MSKVLREVGDAGWTDRVRSALGRIAGDVDSYAGGRNAGDRISDHRDGRWIIGAPVEVSGD